MCAGGELRFFAEQTEDGLAAHLEDKNGAKEKNSVQEQ